MSTNAIQATRETLAYALIKNKAGLIGLLKRNGVEVPDNINDKQLTVALLAASSKNTAFKNDLSEYLSKSLPTKDGYASFAADEQMFGFTGIDDFMYSDNATSSGSLLTRLTGGASTVKTVPKPTSTASATVNRLTGSTSTGYSPTGVAPAGSLGNISGYKPSVTLNDLSGQAGAGTEKSGSGLWSWLKTNLLTPETVQQGINLGLTAIANKQQQKSNQIATEADAVQQKQQQIIAAMSAGNVPQQKGSSVMTWVLVGIGLLVVGVTVYYVTKKK